MPGLSIAMLRVWRILIRAAALKMASWSKAILRRLEESGPAGALASIDAAAGEPIQSSSPLPSSTDEVGMQSSVTEPGSGGPPAHWLERVRQGAPQLLRLVAHQNKQTQLASNPAPSAAKKTAPLAQVPEHQPPKPGCPLGPLGKKALVEEVAPARWPERARRGAPQLLRLVAHQNKQTQLASNPAPSAAKKTAPLAQVPEHQPPKPGYPLGPLGEKASVEEVEPVRQGAPQTLRSIAHQNKQTRLAPGSVPSVAGKAASLAQVPEHQPEKPIHPVDRSEEKAPHWRHALKPVKRAETGVPCSISEKPTRHAEPAFPGTPRQKPLTLIPAARSQPKGKLQPLPLRVAAPPPRAYPEATFPPQRMPERPTSLSCLDEIVDTVPAAGSSRVPQEPSEDHWPQLPETAPADPSNEPLVTIRERERLRRLDDEQRGIYGARRISA
jgi:hypothetical protein